MARPPKINDIIGTRPDGTKVHRWERIVDMIAGGTPLIHAANANGIHRDTLDDWLNKGATATVNRLAGKRINTYETVCAAFSDAVTRARGEWAAAHVLGLDRLARGGIEQRTVVEKWEVARDDTTGSVSERVVERKVTVEHTLPSESAIMFLLERQVPGYQRRDAVELSGPDGGPIPVETQNAALLDRFRRLRGELPAGQGGVIDVDAVDDDEPMEA